MKLLTAVMTLAASIPLMSCQELLVREDREPASVHYTPVQSKLNCSSVVSSVNSDGITTAILAQQGYHPNWADELLPNGKPAVSGHQLSFSLPDQQIENSIVVSRGIVNSISMKIEKKYNVSVAINSPRGSAEYNDLENGLLYRTDCEAQE